MARLLLLSAFLGVAILSPIPCTALQGGFQGLQNGQEAFRRHEQDLARLSIIHAGLERRTLTEDGKGRGLSRLSIDRGYGQALVQCRTGFCQPFTSRGFSAGLSIERRNGFFQPANHFGPPFVTEVYSPPAYGYAPQAYPAYNFASLPIYNPDVTNGQFNANLYSPPINYGPFIGGEQLTSPPYYSRCIPLGPHWYLCPR